MRMGCGAGCGAVAAALLVATAMAQPCQRAFPGATFDLSGLMGNDYTWTDSRSATEWSYDYTFAFCGPVTNLPPKCAQADFPGTNYPAFQWQNTNTLTNISNKICNPVSNPISPSGGTLRPYQLALIDPNNPAYGVELVYDPISDVTNLPCSVNPDGTPGPGRQLTLVMRCGYEPFPAPSTVANPTDTFITEESICNYNAYSWTQAGCPTECKIGGNGKTCSARGICGWDTEISSARCFCDDGYISSDCGAPANPIPTGAIVGALFGGLIFTAAAMLGVAFYLARVRKATSSVDGFYGQVNP